MMYDILCNIPTIDMHTHVDADHLTARGLDDILLYHMVNSEFYTAGCVDGSRLDENPSEEERIRRLEQAIPLIPAIQNTSGYWGVRVILRDLYGWEEPVTLENWRMLDEIIHHKSKDPLWARQILKKANIVKSNTELWRRKSGSADDIFNYSMEWAFFTRPQWMQFDTALMELENAWSQDEPGPPLPVTVGKNKPVPKRQIHTLADVHEAVDYYVSKIPCDKVLSTAQHFSSDIHYHTVTEAEMVQALEKRHCATQAEQEVYSNYIIERFFCCLEQKESHLVYQFSSGAEPLPFETGSRMTARSLFEIGALISRHPKIQFLGMHAHQATSQTFHTLVRELPNLSVSGFWWHNFFPSQIYRALDERLDMVPANKQIGFFSDAYCLDWSYAKLMFVRMQLGKALDERIASGQYTQKMAENIAKKLMYDTPNSILHMHL